MLKRKRLDEISWEDFNSLSLEESTVLAQARAVPITS